MTDGELKKRILTTEFLVANKKDKCIILKEPLWKLIDSAKKEFVTWEDSGEDAQGYIELISEKIKKWFGDSDET